jgi:histidine triad (HIT) family protein
LICIISSNWWPNNPGIVIIAPKNHIENIFTMSDNLLAKIHILSKKISIAIKEIYRCDGITLRQHNEPDGGQDLWHYHLHIIPRWKNDMLYERSQERYLSDPKDRLPYAEKLKSYFIDDPIPSTNSGGH